MSRISASRRRRSRDEPRIRSRRDDRIGPPSRRRGPLLAVVAVALLVSFALYAIWRNPQGQWGVSVQLSGSAKEVLLDLGRRYQEMDSYEDRMLMRLEAPNNARWPGDRADLLVRFVRPNRIRLQVSRGTNQLLLTSDGEHLHTQLLDENMRNFDNQMVQRDAPANLTLATLFSATEIAEVDRPDQLVSALMGLPCPLVVSQLSLLLDPEFMPQLIASARHIERLPDASLSARACSRVRLVTENGEFTFWIDQPLGLLRRIEYPPPLSSATTRPGSASDNEVESAAREELAKSSVTADLDNVRAGGVFPPSNFRQHPADTAKLVQHFIVPPLDVSADVLGKRVSGFEFIDLRGDAYSDRRLTGRMKLLVWFNNTAPSHAAMKKLASLESQLRAQGENDVQFLGICTEPSTVMSHDQVQRLADQWQISFPIVRDLAAHGRDVFGIEQAPTMVLLDDDDIVQLFEVGGNSNLDQELPIVFEKLRHGEPIAQQYLDFLAERQRAYRQLLAAASIDAPPPIESAAPTKTRDATDPIQLELQLVWTSEVLKRPGNLTVNGNHRPPYILVNDGWHQVHEFSFDGTRLDTHSLGSDVTTTDLRCYFGRGGIHVAIAELAPHVSVFDERWRRLFDYPRRGFRHVAIQDALAEDLDRDGRVELYVAFAADEGVHCINADGSLAWRESSITDAMALASSHDRTGERFLLVTRQSGRVTPISADGTLNQSITTQPLQHLMSSPRLADDASFCGVAFALDGRRVIVGLDKTFNEIWSHTTPSGMFRRQTRMITWAPWTQIHPSIGAGCWLVADHEGTVHVFSEDGLFHDQFSYGSPVHGIAAAQDGARNLLFLSTHDTVRAWAVSAKMK
jgi:hypothetical protein